MLGADVSWNNLLRRLRLAAGLTQAEWSALISAAARPGSNAAWSTDSIGRWERGEHPPNAATTEAIATVCRDYRLFEVTSTDEPLLRTSLAQANLAVTRRSVQPAQPPTIETHGGGEGLVSSDQTTRRDNLYQIVLAGRMAEMRANNLPAPISSFVGREDDMAGVRRALEAARLVTLVGTGGCGKTRL